MRTEAELNEALARFSGWRKADLGWTSGDNYFYIEPPDFCNSLDACVEWLGPLFAEWEIKRLRGMAVAPFEAIIAGKYARQDTPALAFARAAEQAMDAEKGKKE